MRAKKGENDENEKGGSRIIFEEHRGGVDCAVSIKQISRKHRIIARSWYN